MPNLNDNLRHAADQLKFLELGAVSPDLSYLALADRKNQTAWADLMHYTKTGQIIKTAIRRVKAMKDETKRIKLLAWLMGYTSHVGGDITIHPVIYDLVGDYATHQTPHRRSEMHQDVYIFESRMNLSLDLSDYLRAGIGACKDVSGHLDTDIVELWMDALGTCHPDAFKSHKPNIHDWYNGFQTIVEDIAVQGNKLLPLARHVTVHEALVYPLPNEVDHAQYIKSLKTPVGQLPYDEIFDKAIQNVISLWKCLSDYMTTGKDSSLDQILDWNLDRGFVAGDTSERITMWSDK